MVPNLTDISEKALQAARDVLAGAPMNVRKDLSTSSGFNAYNLEPIAINLQPVITPWRNSIARKKNTRGGNTSEWRYISQLLAKFADATPSSEGAAGNRLNYSATPASATFAEVTLGDQVNWAAEDAAQGFEGDLKARAVTNLLLAVMMMEEQIIGFGRRSNLGSVTAPTVTTSASGGTIAAGTYKVYARAITGLGDGTIARGRKSTATTTSALGGSTNSMTADTPVVPGALQYEWYVDDGASGAVTLQATTGINSVSLTALTTTGSVLPADNVTNSLGMDGLLAQTFANSPAGNILSLATGTDGVGTDFQLSDIDAQNKFVWDNAKASPETIWMNSTQIARMTNLWLAANGGPTMFVQAGSADMLELTGGYLLTKYVNKASGRLQNVRIHPYLADGTIMAYSNLIPFPTGGDQVGVDIEVSRDYQQVDYPATGHFWKFDVYTREVLRLKFTGGAWLVNNVRSNVAA